MKPFLKILSLFIFAFLFSSPSLAAPCPAGPNPYRPTQECETETDLIHYDIDDYQLTCTAKPKVKVNFESDQEPLNLSYSSLPCIQTDQYGNCLKYQTDGKLTTQIYAHLDQAQLGGFGADAQIIHQSSPDRTAAVYPFQALFDQPNTYYPATASALPKEAYRTYWRATTFQQQVKAKAKFIRQNKDYPDLALPSLKEKEKYQNYEIQYFDDQDDPQTKTIRQLAKELGRQARCLLVVDPTIDLNLLLKKFEIKFCDYSKAYSKLKPDTKAAYDALLPLPLDNYRSYLAQLSRTFSIISSLYGENLPYLAALDQGLNNPQTGLINLYSPQWVNQQREDQLTSDKLISRDVERSQMGGRLIQLQKQITFGDFDLDQCDNTIDAIYLPSPLTHPQHLGLTSSLSQKVTVPVQITRTLTYEYTYPSPSPTPSPTPTPQTPTPPPLTPTPTPTPTATQTSSTWHIKGLSQVTGKPIVIANNPAQKNITTSLSSLEENSSSLYQLFTTSSASAAPKDTRIDAPISFFETQQGSINTPAGGSSAPVPRQGGQAHIDLCQLRNQWLIPSSQQDTTLNCQDPYSYISNQLGADGPLYIRTNVYDDPIQFSPQAKETFQEAADCFGISPKILAAISTVEAGNLYSHPFDRSTEAFCWPSGDGCGSWGPFQFLHNKDGPNETVAQRNQRDPDHPYSFNPDKCPNPAAEFIDAWSDNSQYGNAYNQCHNTTGETNICSLVDSAYAAAKMVSFDIDKNHPYSDSSMWDAIYRYNQAACQEGRQYPRLGNMNYCEYGVWFNQNYDKDLNYVGD